MIIITIVIKVLIIIIIIRSVTSITIIKRKRSYLYITLLLGNNTIVALKIYTAFKIHLQINIAFTNISVTHSP